MAKKKAAKKVARQKSLPGMLDRGVAALDRAAFRYAEVRDERMAWTEKEVEAKKRVQTLMHELKRAHYAHGQVEIDLEPEGEKVRVRIHSQAPAEPRDRPPVEPPPVKEPTTEESPREEPAEDPDAEYESEEEQGF